MKTKGFAPLRFGGVEISFPVWLAPMAGYTDSAMRTLCLEHGAGAVYSELTSAEGLRRDAGKTLAVLETAEGEHPVAAHLFGADPPAMAEAAKRAEACGRFDWIDVNCGCPVKKVVARGAGAALLKDLPRLGRVVEAVKRAVSLPVTVKTRIGFHAGTPGHLEILRAAEESGADLLAVHARMAKDFHAGPADWEKLAEMKAEAGIPLLGNGGAERPEDAIRMVERTGVDGVLIGRAAIGNPWIFEWIRTGEPRRVTPAMRRETMAEHLRRLSALCEAEQGMTKRPSRHDPETAACIRFRTHLPYYVKGLFDRKRLLRRLPELLSIDAVLEAMDELVRVNEERTREG